MNCTIRPWSMDDADDLAADLNNKKILDNLRHGLPYPYTQSDARDFIDAMRNADKTSTFAFAIAVDGRAVGSIGVFRMDNIHHRTAEMGYYVAEPFWGQGVCTQAVTQVCRQVFDTTDILRIFAQPFARNAASCRVLEKCGFVLEGRLRKNAVKNGEVCDMLLYALVKE